MHRPEKREDGWPTRADMSYWSPAEKAIQDAISAVEAAGASNALTDAVVFLGKARDRVADHVEGKIEITVNVKSCQRCAQDHNLMQFARLSNAVDDWNFYGFCPATAQPVLMKIAEKVA